MRFLAEVPRQFYLNCVQDVMPKMTGIRALLEEMVSTEGVLGSDVVRTFLRAAK